MDVTDLPEGVDPSFLAALPEDMRQEVIDEQRRIQSVRQRAAQNVEAGVSEVDPQFLAALPTNIQEEVSIVIEASPAWATNKSIFDGKSHAIHHFYELFKLISAM